jgi:hypothetical protein
MGKSDRNLDWFENLNIIKVFLFGGVVLIIGYLCVPIIVMLMYRGGMYDAQTGQTGDTIGGTYGPLIGSVGVLLTFLAFWAQFKANQQQKRDLQIERFESRLFSMLETHRNAVAEIKIHFQFLALNPNNHEENSKYELLSYSFEGRSAMIEMVGYLRELFEFLKKINEKPPAEESDLGKIASKVSDDVLYETAYLFFFSGASKDTIDVGTRFWPDNSNDFLKLALDAIEKEANERERSPYDFISTRIPENGLPVETLAADTYRSTRPKYPFGIDHSIWLSHYFRHLYMMVEFVDQQAFLEDEEKWEYVRQIRSQLSVHEQLLVYYNSLSAFGRPWNVHYYLWKYCLVRSISPYTVFFGNPLEKLGKKNDKGKYIFDLLEIEERMTKSNDTPPQG